ncbi:hypothetical protein HDA32_000741 [Spinactinospora alkalitolerans]|uniref:DUF3352 domain-containing protein n=1 Tax=Spinactinospora alkalitolerans TaxID=687207 RepID=A0A852TQ31_9ACTN|nr:DUF3352 domain-containing protein [Spinactinospora alkalitolerans]NYE45621.1 hypothetical protein [Spinactinospora alkalitolerans]
MIPVAAVAGVALLATTVWASDAVVDGLFGGPQPETVLPGSSVMFAKVDLKPNGGQWAAYAQFMTKLPESIRDELGSSEESPAKAFVEAAFPDLDYESDVEPWLGQRFGVAAWETDIEDGVTFDGLAMAVAVAVEDEDAAQDTLADLQREEEGLFYEVRDDFALITPTNQMLADLDAQVESSGALDRNSAYTGDMDVIGSDNIASAWMDLEPVGRLAAAADQGSDYGEYGESSAAEIGELTGRVALGLRIEADYLELRGDVFEVSVNGSSWEGMDLPEPGITALADLPDDSVAAFGGDRLDQLAKETWTMNQDAFESEPGYADFTEATSQLGLSLPQDFTRLIGTRTAFGITDLGGGGTDPWSSSGDVSFQYRATEADDALIQDLIDEAAASSYSSPPGVTTDGDTTVVSSGTTGTGRLGDDPVFQSTMSGLENSHLGFYVDARPLVEESGEPDARQWGAFGGSLTYDDQSNASMVLRWAPSGGA